jgi:hypothetical protein
LRSFNECGIAKKRARRRRFDGRQLKNSKVMLMRINEKNKND